MRNLDHLFTFPIIMVDGNNEDRKHEQGERLGLDTSDEVDLIEGEASIPYYDFISISDRWLPTDASLQNALNGKFDACGVLFAHSGTFIVPWSKGKFISKLKRFMQALAPEETPTYRIISSPADTSDNPLIQGDSTLLSDE